MPREAFQIDVTVKEEPYCERLQDDTAAAPRVEVSLIKPDPESDCSDGQLERDERAVLEDLYLVYLGHEVKKELVIGPEVLQRPVPSAPNTHKDTTRTLLEPLHRNCKHGGDTSSCARCKKTNKVRFACNICERTFCSKAYVLRHQHSHTQNNFFTCDVCKENFRSKRCLNTHLRLHTGEKSFSCDICNKKFTQRSAIIRHLRIHSVDKPFLCEICNKKYTESSTFTRHLRIHSVERPFSCDICEEKFTDSSKLTRHIRLHSGGRRFPCEICNKKFTQRTHLTSHLRGHSGARPYSCDICKKKFTENSSLKKHLRIHSGERPYACDICENKFTDSSKLARHIRIHSGDRPFSCDICKEKFTERATLRKHRRTHTREKFTCDVCKREFSLKSYLSLHLKTCSKRQVQVKCIIEEVEEPSLAGPCPLPDYEIAEAVNFGSGYDSGEEDLPERNSIEFPALPEEEASPPRAEAEAHAGAEAVEASLPLSAPGVENEPRTMPQKAYQIDVTVKEEPYCPGLDDESAAAPRVEDSLIKPDPESDCNDGQLEREERAVLEDLYLVCWSHEVNKETVIGPEVLQRPVPSAPNTHKDTTRTLLEPLHRNCKHGGDTSSCDRCKKTNNVQFSCNICERTFSSKAYVLRHQHMHTQNNFFTCDVCKENFRSKGCLKTHLRLHTGEKSFSCDIGNKKFTQRSTIIRHLRIHSAERPFSCDICEEKFTVKSKLTRHILIHSGDRPFLCEICNKNFKRRSTLITHLRIHIEKRPFSCKICNKKFSRRSYLITHLRIHIEKKKFTERATLRKHREKFTCDICKREFSLKSYLSLHMKTCSKSQVKCIIEKVEEPSLAGPCTLRDYKIEAYEIEAVNFGSENDSDEDEMPERISIEFPALPEEEASPARAEAEAHAGAEAVEASLAPGVKHELGSAFSFVWRDLPDPPLPSAERREKFSENNCGPTTPMPTPYDAFVAIWDRQIMEHIATETNRYAQHSTAVRTQQGQLAPNSKASSWKDTDADELYVFFALSIATGIAVNSDVTEYWAKDGMGPTETASFSKYMTVDRFLLLNRFLHFTDNSIDISHLPRPVAKVHKVAPVVEHLNRRFQELYRLGRNIAIGDSLTQWKRWPNSRQFDNKAASVRIDTYEVCEPSTGYLWRFEVEGRGSDAPPLEASPISGHITSLVLRLLEGLENKGHTVWMDSYYNSPALARVLKALGFDCVGTLRTNRQLVPPELSAFSKQKMSIDQISGATSGDVDIVVWKGQSRVVAMISTYHGNGVRTRDGKTQPIVIHDYNTCAAKIDKKVKMLAKYPLERMRTRVWYKNLFKRLLNVSVLNALVLHQHSPIPTNKTMVHMNFRRVLMNSLLDRHCHRLCPDLPSQGFHILRHLPAEYEILDGKKRRPQIRCIECRTRTATFCSSCNVTLCVFKCFGPYHRALYPE